MTAADPETKMLLHQRLEQPRLGKLVETLHGIAAKHDQRHGKSQEHRQQANEHVAAHFFQPVKPQPHGIMNAPRSSCGWRNAGGGARRARSSSGCTTKTSMTQAICAAPARLPRLSQVS